MPTTGLAVLPDVGQITYNTVTFSSLTSSELNGQPLSDNANRTTKAVQWTLHVKGVATLPSATAPSTDSMMVQLRTLLNAQGGTLTYTGRGFGNVVVNQPGGLTKDVAWGPIPKTFNFQPLGGGRSALIDWQVTFTITELATTAIPPLLQFNEETTVSYDDECYSALSIKGTMEIPMTRLAVNNRTLTQTVDDFRKRFLNLQIDLTRYRVTRRNFNVSRDKRTMEWDFLAEELPFMGLPAFISNARGVFSFRPLKTGLGGVGTCQWICSLRGTYTVIPSQPRRLAWAAFLSLLQFRMNRSRLGVFPGMDNPVAAAQNAPVPPAANFINNFVARLTGLPTNPLIEVARIYQNQTAAPVSTRPILIDFGGDEGLYLDSRTVTFHASWRLCSSLSTILAATGIWRDGGYTDRGLWSASMANVSGWSGALHAQLDPTAEVIVDLGFGPPLTSVTR
jgi:hypothetical protein